jgi:hypothetical protein
MIMVTCTCNRFLLVFLVACCCYTYDYVVADVIISEIAAKGTDDDAFCNNDNGNSDWVELYNNGADAVDITGWILHDDKGPEIDDEAFVFSNTVIAAGAFLVLCTEQENDSNSPQFGIGESDTITLLDKTTTSSSNSSSSNSTNVTSQVQLAERDDGTVGTATVTATVTFALDETDGTFKYTTTPTPGQVNTITTAPPALPSSTSIHERWTAQNALATRFFNMDDDGLPVADGLPALVDFHITMDESAHQDLMLNATYQLYVPY